MKTLLMVDRTRYRAAGGWKMLTCPFCGHSLPEDSRYCLRCGRLIEADAERSAPLRRARGGREAETLSMPILYGMIVALVIAVLFPPWESPRERPAAFLGFHSILRPPEPMAVVSRGLLTIELVVIAVGGTYGAWLFRRK